MQLSLEYFPKIEVAKSWDILPPSSIWEICLFLHCFLKPLTKLVSFLSHKHSYKTRTKKIKL